MDPRAIGRRSRLALRVYLVGVSQLLVVGLVFFAVNRFVRSGEPWEHEVAKARFIIGCFAEVADRPEALRRMAARSTNLVTLYDAGGRLLDSSGGSALAPLPPELRARLAVEHELRVPDARTGPETAVAMFRGDELIGYGLIKMKTPHPPANLLLMVAMALGGVAVVSFVFARSLARPLDRLAAAARSFGAGDLGARAGFRRGDELGDVAQTFDEMAERVNALIRGQREFLADVSHELRTPLARIRVALDIAAEGDVEAARQCLADIGQDWDDLERLVEDVLAAARLELGQGASGPSAPLRPESVEVGALVERVAGRFRSLYPQHGLEVECRARGQLLWADPTLLRRVLDNLLGNAAKYSDAGTTIRLQASADGDCVRFAVVDRGIGIGPLDLPQVFTPFFRSDRSRGRKTGGVGLGLTLAKRIVEAHGGSIDLESAVGRGTSAIFSIPIAAPQLHTSSQTVDAPLTGEGEDPLHAGSRMSGGRRGS